MIVSSQLVHHVNGATRFLKPALPTRPATNNYPSVAPGSRLPDTFFLIVATKAGLDTSARLAFVLRR